jgi:ATP-dependent Clp protease ATP-binding subunit ClpX
MVEGSKVAVPRGMNAKVGMTMTNDMLDTTNILFIFSGSFAGIEETVERRVNKGTRMGFGSVETTSKKKLSKTDVYSDVTEEDLLEFGIIPELLGRLPVRTSVLELTEDEMVKVLTEPKHALIKQKQALFAMDGVQLTFDEGALRAIAREAIRMETGARSLRTLVERVTRPFAYDTPSDPTIMSIRITEDTVCTGNAVIERRRQAVG